MSDATSAEAVNRKVRTYMVVFVALAGLTILTVAVAYLRLPSVPALIIAFAIAALKASLVAGYFMHLISEKKIIYSILLLTVGLLIGMYALTGLGLSDQDMSGR